MCNALITPESRPRTFLITGTTDGIGKHTSQKLASDGSNSGNHYALILHGRKSPSDPIVKSLIEDLESRGAAQVAYLQADLSDLRQVESLADQVIAQLQLWQQQPSSTESSFGDNGSSSSRSSTPNTIPSLDVLINNAGVFDPKPRHSAQGFDATMAINVLAPFVLTRRLLPSLVRGNDDVRIITTSSISQSRTLPDLDSLFARRRDEDGEYDGKALPYSAHSFYSYSKLGDLLFTVQLAKVLSNYQLLDQHSGKTDTITADAVKESYYASQKATTLLSNMHRIQCLTMDPGTVNTKMLLAGWGPCGISVKEANNTYKLATGEEYAFSIEGTTGTKSGSYHFGWGASSDSKDEVKLDEFWKKLCDCTGVDYDDLSDCL